MRQYQYLSLPNLPYTNNKEEEAPPPPKRKKSFGGYTSLASGATSTVCGCIWSRWGRRVELALAAISEVNVMIFKSWS